MALCIAASLASGLKANFGTMTKPLHIGQCCRNGLLAALLAEGGFDAATDAFEHQQGFLNVFNGPGTFDIAQTVRELGRAMGDRGQVDRAQAVSLLRQHASRHQHGAEVAARGEGHGR